MKLCFKNSQGQERVIAENVTRGEAYPIMNKFCEERKFKVYYVREWKDEKLNALIFDVGSHTEFFILKD